MVYLLSIQYKYGVNNYIFSTHENAMRGVYNWIEEYWHEVSNLPYDVLMAEDNLNLYFDKNIDEDFEIIELKIDDGIF